MKQPLTLLFLCTGNSCRGQMAVGWAKHLKSGEIDAYSASVEKHGLNPLAVRAMAEAGVDIAGHSSKTADELPVRHFDYVRDEIKAFVEGLPGALEQSRNGRPR